MEKKEMREIIEINSRRIGSGYPTYLVADMSANHNQDFNQAIKILKAAKEAGADALKLQTYTPDTLTINCNSARFQIKGTRWDGQSLYELYSKSYTPWEWQPKLNEIAKDLGIDLFSTPFDPTAVDFLKEMAVPAYKIASFEIVDLPLLRKVAQTGKPIIMSTGMASLAEIDEAVRTIKEAGCTELALLKCTSAYPASPEDMNLRTITHLAEIFGLSVGISDHTLGIAVPIAAVSLGACIVEKHFTLSRSIPGPDSEFSMEPDEFRSMANAIRQTEQALGKVSYDITEKEKNSQVFRRSLFVVKNMHCGDEFTEENIRSIRPGNGLHTRYLEKILGRKARIDIKKGTPLDWSLVE